MQTDVGDFELTPHSSENAALLTPNIVFSTPVIASTYNPLHNNENQSISNTISTTTITTTAEKSLIASSADVKVSKIEDELKQSLHGARRPTPSPFQSISSTNSFNLNKSVPVITTDDGTTIEMPSTADVKKKNEAHIFRKFFIFL